MLRCGEGGKPAMLRRRGCVVRGEGGTCYTEEERVCSEGGGDLLC